MLAELPFTMSASLENGTLVITLTGELDFRIRVTLAGQLSEFLAQQPARLIYDLTKVPYIDAGSLHLLMQAARHTPHKPVLVDPAPIVVRLLQITGLDTKCTVIRMRHDDAWRSRDTPGGWRAGADAP
jgi:anti-anti-sigma factor